MGPVLEAAVMRKIAWRLLPFVGLGYFFNALDRSNVAIAALTMNKSLGFTAAEYGLGAGAFFWSYVLFQSTQQRHAGQTGRSALVVDHHAGLGTVLRRDRAGNRRDEFRGGAVRAGRRRGRIFRRRDLFHDLLVSRPLPRTRDGRVLCVLGHRGVAWVADFGHDRRAAWLAGIAGLAVDFPDRGGAVGAAGAVRAVHPGRPAVARVLADLG